mmetsp:Transcript_64031/g.118965  ORF Transcript_64031/g.118965 Transcript_64031/m.118965 type:complete len:728 (+) Transcript_64031:144-2327(+)
MCNAGEQCWIKQLLRPDREQDATPAETFEERAAQRSSKYEFGLIVVEILMLLVFMTSNQGRHWPVQGINLWPPLVWSLCARCFVRLLRSRSYFSTQFALDALFLLDGLLLASSHPNMAHSIWFEEQPPVAPHFDKNFIVASSITNLTEEEASAFIQSIHSTHRMWERAYDTFDLESSHFHEMVGEEYTMAQYSLAISVWYNCLFLLPHKQAMVLVPIAVVMYLVAAAAGESQLVGNTTREKGSCMSLEVTLLLLCCVIAVVSKGKLERAQRIEHTHYQEQQKQAEKERHLRMEAESSATRSSRCHSGPRPLDVVTEASPTFTRVMSCYSQSVSGRSVAARSVLSAPAVVHEGRVMSQTRRSGECLPPDAAVWVEGQPMPQKVSSVKRGDRVLCHDSLCLAPKYVEVLSSDTLVGKAAWVEVKLEDETCLTLTADHPTQPRQLKSDLPASNHVPAAELKPGIDNLMVLKMQPVLVQSVERQKADPDTYGWPGPGLGTRVSIMLQHPDRHEVFVAPSGTMPGQGMSTVAVGSADIAAGSPEIGSGRPFGLTVKRTFLDVEEYESKAVKRSASCPPKMDAREKESARKPIQAVKDVKPQFLPRLRRTASLSDVTSQSSRQSSAPSDVDVLVAVAASKGAATVTEMLQLRRAGLPSKGSVGHDFGTCQPCFFENRHQHGDGPPCFKGALCDRCHCPHDLIGRRKHVPGPTRNVRRKQAREEEVQCGVCSKP